MTQFQSARPWYRKQLFLAIAGALACSGAPALAQDAAVTQPDGASAEATNLIPSSSPPTSAWRTCATSVRRSA